MIWYRFESIYEWFNSSVQNYRLDQWTCKLIVSPVRFPVQCNYGPWRPAHYSSQCNGAKSFRAEGCKHAAAPCTKSCRRHPIQNSNDKLFKKKMNRSNDEGITWFASCFLGSSQNGNGVLWTSREGWRGRLESESLFKLMPNIHRHISYNLSL